MFCTAAQSVPTGVTCPSEHSPSGSLPPCFPGSPPAGSTCPSVQRPGSASGTHVRRGSVNTFFQRLGATSGEGATVGLFLLKLPGSSPHQCSRQSTGFGHRQPPHQPSQAPLPPEPQFPHQEMASWASYSPRSKGNYIPSNHRLPPRALPPWHLPPLCGELRRAVSKSHIPHTSLPAHRPHALHTRAVLGAARR